VCRDIWHTIFYANLLLWIRYSSVSIVPVLSSFSTSTFQNYSKEGASIIISYYIYLYIYIYITIKRLPYHLPVWLYLYITLFYSMLKLSCLSLHFSPYFLLVVLSLLFSFCKDAILFKIMLSLSSLCFVSLSRFYKYKIFSIYNFYLL